MSRIIIIYGNIDLKVTKHNHNSHHKHQILDQDKDVLAIARERISLKIVVHYVGRDERLHSEV
jgi:hypothetical protein